MTSWLALAFDHVQCVSLPGLHKCVQQVLHYFRIEHLYYCIPLFFFPHRPINNNKWNKWQMNEWIQFILIQDKMILISWSIYLPTTAVSASVVVGGGPQINFCLGPTKCLGQHWFLQEACECFVLWKTRVGLKNDASGNQNGSYYRRCWACLSTLTSPRSPTLSQTLGGDSESISVWLKNLDICCQRIIIQL